MVYQQLKSLHYHNYNHDEVADPIERDRIPRANGRLIYERTRKGWKQTTQDDLVANDRSLSLLDQEDRVTQLLKRVKLLHAVE
jgi:Fe-S cluster biosynthesis and repair protein YggX